MHPSIAAAVLSSKLGRKRGLLTFLAVLLPALSFAQTVTTSAGGRMNNLSFTANAPSGQGGFICRNAGCWICYNPDCSKRGYLSGSTITFNANIAASNISGTNTGDVTLGAVGATPSANGASLSGQVLTLQPASATLPGVVTAGAQSFGGAKTFASTISASNLSGTNTGDITLGAVGASPNANAASLSGQVLTLQPADATTPGILTAGAQGIGGAKTFASTIAASNFSGSSSGTNTGDVTIGTANGLSIASQALSLQLSDATHNGALSQTDWSTFNNKAPTANPTFTGTVAEAIVNASGLVTLNGGLAVASATTHGPGGNTHSAFGTYDVVLDDGDSGSPVLLMLNGANSNGAIDVASGSLRFIKKYYEAGSGAMLSLNLSTSNATFGGAVFADNGIDRSTGTALNIANGGNATEIDTSVPVVSSSSGTFATGVAYSASGTKQTRFYKPSATTIDLGSTTAAGVVQCVLSAGITVTGAALGDSCSLGMSTDSSGDDGMYQCVVTAADTVKVKFCSTNTYDPPNRTYTPYVTR